MENMGPCVSKFIEIESCTWETSVFSFIYVKEKEFDLEFISFLSKVTIWFRWLT